MNAVRQDIEFRQYAPEDAPAVIGIFRSNIPKYFSKEEEQGLRDFLESDLAQHYYLIQKDGEVLGAGGIGLNDRQPPTVSLCWGMVHKDHLGAGLGKELTQFRIDLAQQTYGDLPLVISTSQHTRGFYEKYGFEPTRHEIDGFSRGIDICEMTRPSQLML